MITVIVEGHNWLDFANRGEWWQRRSSLIRKKEKGQAGGGGAPPRIFWERAIFWAPPKIFWELLGLEQRCLWACKDTLDSSKDKRQNMPSVILCCLCRCDGKIHLIWLKRHVQCACKVGEAVCLFGKMSAQQQTEFELNSLCSICIGLIAPAH